MSLLPPRNAVAPAPRSSSEEVLTPDEEEEEEEVDSENVKLSSSSSLPLLLAHPFLARLFSFLAFFRSFLTFSLCTVFSSTTPLVS